MRPVSSPAWVGDLADGVLTRRHRAGAARRCRPGARSAANACTPRARLGGTAPIGASLLSVSAYSTTKRSVQPSRTRFIIILMIFPRRVFSWTARGGRELFVSTPGEEGADAASVRIRGRVPCAACLAAVVDWSAVGSRHPRRPFAPWHLTAALSGRQPASPGVCHRQRCPAGLKIKSE